MTMPDLQRYPCNKPVVFLIQKVFVSLSFSIASDTQKNAQVTCAEKPQMKKQSLISNSYLIKTFLMVSLLIIHCHLCIEGHFKLRLRSL